MTNNKTTKHALLSSVLALMICVAMLIGTTFAWFTDNVTSKGNIIKSGNLAVGMYWAEGDEDPATFTDWKDASKGAIFSEALWEPGYTEAKHLKIVNEGNLALKYQLQILANGIVSELANVIDVYYLPEAKQLTRENLATATKLGVLSDVLNNGLDNALINNVAGELEKGETDVVTLALKMQESAGNEYQNLSIGSDFTVKLIATQLASEEDSFGKNYDANAKFPAQDFPLATVLKLTGDELDVDIAGGGHEKLDTGYQFLPTESGDIVDEMSPYKDWHADFVVSADRTVKGNSMMLAGYYKLFDDVMNLGGAWIGLTTSEDITAGTEIRLVKPLLEGLTYSMVCNFGNDGIGFLCGAKDLDGSNEGTTLTVRLRIFEVVNGQETNNYYDAGIFEYTFGGKYVTAENGAVYFYAEDGDVVLYNARGVEDATFEIPEGVTEIDASAFEGQTATKTVVFPSTIKSVGYNAFKNSAVESVTLNEGLTEIGYQAFNGANDLADFNIPSTVTTIGCHAFRLTAATNLVIPATVKSIDSSFRDMPNLTTVTFEGNTQIAPYAFRGCASLTDVYLKGDDVTFAEKDANGNVGMVFTNNTAGNAEKITIHVVNSTVAARVITAQTSAEKYKVELDNEVYLAKSVKNSNELDSAINSTPYEQKKFIVLQEGTYADDINFTIAAQGEQKGDTYIKAADSASVTLTGKTTLGLYIKLTTNVAQWDGKVVFDGVIFDQSAASTHSIEVQNVKKFILKDCTIIGDGEYGIGSNSGCIAYNSEITGCTFKDASIQVLGNFGTGLVIDDCTFNDSRVNVQSGNGVTIKNSKFNATLTDSNVGDSFYLIRGSANGNGIPVTITNCEIKIDSTVNGVATAQEKWGAIWNRGTNTPWTVTGVDVILTNAAKAQDQLLVIKTAGGPINYSNLTINGVKQ